MACCTTFHFRYYSLSLRRKWNGRQNDYPGVIIEAISQQPYHNKYTVQSLCCETNTLTFPVKAEGEELWSWVEEHHADGHIVHAGAPTEPSLSCLLDETRDSDWRLVFAETELHGVLVWHHVPESIRGENHRSVLGDVESPLEEVWRRYHAGSMCYCIANGSTHRQAGATLISQPHPIRSHHTIGVHHRKHPASILRYSTFLWGRAGLVVDGQRLGDLIGAMSPSTENASGVTDVGDENMIRADDGQTHRWATHFRVYAWIVEKLVFSCLNDVWDGFFEFFLNEGWMTQEIEFYTPL